jgi:hypothetical protein
LARYAEAADMAPPTLRPARYGLLASAVGAAALVLHHDLRPMHPQFSASLERTASAGSDIPAPAALSTH